jgi:hypothetical protein
MRLIKLLKRYSLNKRPTLRVVNHRIGTSVIPMDQDSTEIFFQYLTNKIHALTFEGSEIQLTKIIHKLRDDQGFKIEKMKMSLGRGKEKLVLLHLKLPNNIELRRLIKLTTI